MLNSFRCDFGCAFAYCSSLRLHWSYPFGYTPCKCYHANSRSFTKRVKHNTKPKLAGHVQSQRHTSYLTPAPLQNGEVKGAEWSRCSPRLLERGVRGVR